MTQSITAFNLIRRSLYLINALAEGETPSAEQANDALSTLNEMIDAWSTQTLAVYGSVTDEFVLTPGVQSYTYGAGGTLDAQRPVYVDDAYCIRNGVTTPVRIITDDEWNRISLKAQPGAVAEELLWVNSYPLSEVHVWPIPDTAVTLGLSVKRVLTSVPSLQTTIALPPGYIRALRYNLAVDLWPEYSNRLTDIGQVRKTAMDSKGDIKVANMQDITAKFDDVPNVDTARSWDWRTA